MMNQVSIVLAGASAYFLTGWALNSQMLLGKLWKDEKDKKACGSSSKDMHFNLGAEVLVSLVLAIATCVAISIFEKTQVPVAAKSALEKLSQMFFNQDNSSKSMLHSMYTILFIWVGFILPVSVEEVIWCGHKWKHWILQMISKLIGLMAIAATVTFLS